MCLYYVFIQSLFTFKCLITVDTATNYITSYLGMRCYKIRMSSNYVIV
ncbi:unnamed protein product [Callosobruchus maculatus]|uniref:Uncharacterized protein n=1 Tax=Callosobruchus maculatus TaxID=64391 RepID=A0A653BKI9_CALMS|nr:unnamed protein product [Callosobruchus maculatus]